MTINPTTTDDIPALQRVLKRTELFPAEMLPDMIRPFLAGDSHDQVWLTATSDTRPVGFCFAVEEALTQGTWNMRAIAVDPAHQGHGHGGAMVRRLEEMLSALGHRILIVDTSGTDAFARTRAFYRQHGYMQEARIRDYWAAGDDRIVFRKALI